MFYVNIYADGLYSIHSTAYGAEINAGRHVVATICTALDITHRELRHLANYYTGN